MGKTVKEIVKEIMEDEKLLSELLADMNDPARVAEFLKDHGCTESVSEFIAELDRYN